MRGRGRGRGRGRYRRVARMLEPALLLLLHHGPAHGYTLMERLGEFGLEGLNPSVVYRVLRDMESRGWVSSTWARVWLNWGWCTTWRWRIARFALHWR
jgi:hypothetical protein